MESVSISGRDNNLNLIRVLAALAVVVSHSFSLHSGNLQDEPFRRASGVSLGEIAVDVFFVISGYLVTKSAATRSIGSFLRARARRIFPGLWVMLFVTACVASVYWTTMSFAAFWRDPMAGGYVASNALLVGGIAFALPGVFEHNPIPGAVNGSLWTLVVEVRLYIALAIGAVVLTFAKSRFGWWRTFAVVGLLVSGWGGWRLCFMFFSGAVLYTWSERVTYRAWLAVSLSAIVVAALALGWLALYALALPYVVIAAAFAKTPRLMQYNRIGDYSYGIYIYAFPLQQTLMWGAPQWSLAELMLWSVLGSALFGVASWHLVERPWLNPVSDKSRGPAALVPDAAA